LLRESDDDEEHGEMATLNKNGPSEGADHSGPSEQADHAGSSEQAELAEFGTPHPDNIR
jgi:hypothetical protein